MARTPLPPDDDLTALETRAARPDEDARVRAALGAATGRAAADGRWVVICGIPGGAILGGAVIREPADGSPPGTETPVSAWIEGVCLAQNLPEHAARGVVGRMILGIEDELRGRGIERWTLTLEATAHAQIRGAEDVGYRPTGRGPYREIGPGVVEYLHGYTGPEGFLVDFRRVDQ